MKELKLKYLAWIILLMYCIHLVEEYVFNLAGWMNNVLGADLSTNEFIWINAAGLTIFLIFAVLYSFGLGSEFVLWIFNTIFFVNGILHFILGVGTLTYSPGVVTGILLFIPVGWYIYRRLKTELPDRLRFTGTIMGVMILGLIAMISFNI